MDRPAGERFGNARAITLPAMTERARDTSDGPGARSRLFTVRVWDEADGGDPDYRGTVRDVASGANRSFRSWEGLTAFLSDQLRDDQAKGDY